MRRDPFEMLERCHRRLEETMAALRQPTREALDEAMSFFDRAMQRHEQDEEKSLFPRLVGVAKLAPILDRLTVQHRDQAALIEELRWLGAAPGLATVGLADVIYRLEEAYSEHVAVEERELFPAARELLDAGTLEAMAGEMEARRGR
jgi:hemerythrin-like domain-containing protein